jgi:hypothetical protein
VRLRTLAGPVALACALVGLFPRTAPAFGDQGAFDARVLLTGGQTASPHTAAAGRWAWELVQRTSAPAKLRPTTVTPESPSLVTAPFLFWSGDSAAPPLGSSEIAGLRRFLALGGVLFVDDAAPAEGGPGAFGLSARRELARVLPDAAPVTLPRDHVIFRTFYFLHRAEGRVLGPPSLDAIVRSGAAQVIFSSHDVGGALARGPAGAWELPVVPGGDAQRERAIRLAVNVAMYALCSNYKHDQVHAPFLMRRRTMSIP